MWLLVQGLQENNTLCQAVQLSEHVSHTPIPTLGFANLVELGVVTTAAGSACSYVITATFQMQGVIHVEL